MHDTNRELMSACTEHRSASLSSLTVVTLAGALGAIALGCGGPPPDACPSGTFGEACTPWTVCDAGSFEQEAPSANRDRRCTPCPSETFSAAPGASACAAWTRCAAGTFASSPGSATRDRTCAACAEGTYAAAPNASTCSAWSSCSAGERISRIGSATNDRGCAPCSPGTFSTEANALDCLAWMDCAAGSYVSVAGTTNRDRACEACEAGTYAATSNQDACLALMPCAPGTVLVAPGSPSMPTVCEPCMPGEYCAGADSAPTPCGGASFDDDGDPATACVPTRECAPGEFVSGESEPTSDRACAACAPETFSTTSNAALCAPWSVCPTGTAEELPGTPTSDRTCAAAEWLRQFGSPGGDVPLAVVTDVDGSIYVVGEIDRNDALPGETSAGDEDAFIRKYDVLGNALWTHQFGTSARDRAVGVAISGGIVLVAGTTGGALPGLASSGGTDAFVRAYRPDGVELWTRQLGSAGNDGLEGIAPLASGGVAVTGYTNGALHGEPAARAFDALVMTLDSAGTVLWTRVFGSVSDDRGLGVAVGSDGRIVVVGTAAAALPGETGFGFDDAFIRMYGPDGTTLWTHQFGTTSSDSPVGVGIDARGWVLVGGYTSGVMPGEVRVGGVDSFACALDPAGNEMWLHQYGTIYDDHTHSAAIDASGNLLVTGSTAGTFPGETYAGMSDTFVGAFDGAGTELWIRELGTTSYDVAQAIVAGVGGSVVVAGYTAGVFPGQTNAGSSDVFLTLLAP